MTLTITLIRSPDASIPPTQVEAYRLLETMQGKPCTMEDLQQKLGLRSVLPVRSRLEHLADKGIIAIS
jgi:LexA DNA binding domain